MTWLFGINHWANAGSAFWARVSWRVHGSGNVVRLGGLAVLDTRQGAVDVTAAEVGGEGRGELWRLGFSGGVVVLGPEMWKEQSEPDLKSPGCPDS